MQPVRIQPLTPDLLLYIIFGKATVTEHFKNPSYTKANRDTRQRTHAAVILRSPCFGQPLLQPIKSEGKRNEKENKPAVSVASDTGANCKPAAISAAAANDVARLPDVTPEMSDASYWADRQKGSRSVILTPEEIRACNQDTAAAEGTMVTDLKSAGTTFNGLERNKEVLASAESDAKYYFGWTYLGSSEKATWPEFEKLIRNCSDPKAAASMRVRYGIAVNRTVLRVFPSDTPIWDDPADTDFDYESVSAVAVNDPILIYTTSADGKYYLARTEDRSPFHNYVVYLPVRRADGSYEKQMALIPETAQVSVGYLPLTEENIAMVALNSLGDTYGWGGMMDVEDCSGMVRTVYSCFGVTISRNGNWQWNSNLEKIDLSKTPLWRKNVWFSTGCLWAAPFASPAMR